MIVPVGSMAEQSLLLVPKRGGEVTTQNIAPVRFVPLLGTQGWEQ
jgi:protein-L-isoaspartate O-methyltransferase